MYKKLVISVIAILAVISISAQNTSEFYKFKVNNIKGEKVNLEQYKDKVILIVNTASKCGLTPQYEGLEALYNKYKSQGFVVLGFPCNQFMGQEPGTAEEIEKFCSMKYNITFPLFEKIKVNGDDAHQLYKFLKEKLPLESADNEIRWNFEKFLIDRNGNPVKRFAPKIKPEELSSEIETLLK